MLGGATSADSKELNMSDTHGQTDEVTTGRRPPPRPRWVIWLAIAIGAAVLVFLGMHLLAGGGSMQHMPGMHHGLPAPAVQSGPGGGEA